jgi:asparagine synthase (glutamine-hydrolysing)
MFRYFGFSWDVAAPAQAAVAQRLDESIRCVEGWQLAHGSPGLRVFTIGGRPGVNEGYSLPGARGVVLGHLFRRRPDSCASRHIDLSASEGQWILQTEGRALVDDYWGRYVAILGSGPYGALVLRDPSGTLPCFQKDIEGVNVLFSWLEDLIAFVPDLPAPRVNWDAIAAFITHRCLGGRETALEGVTQILPGQLTTLGQAGRPSLPLWSAAAIAGNPIEPEPQHAAAQLRHEVINCVHAWSSTYEAMLLRLSGGVDSAILLGSLCAMPVATQVTCLNYHSPGSDSDERGYARVAAAKAGVELLEQERDIDFRLEDVLAVSRTPTPQTYVGRMGTGRIDAEVARAHGASAMFTGAGGDQLFFQLRCTWPAADYLSHHGPGRGFVQASLDAARLAKVSLWQSMWRALVDQRHRTSPLIGVREHLTLARREALDGIRQPERYVHPELLGESTLPIGKFQQLQMLINASDYYDPYLREAAPELVNPLLSQPLIELCLRLPTWLLTHGGQGRALARQAFARELPREIAMRQSKGGMEEHIATVLHRNLPLAREILLDGHLVRNGLLDRQKVEAALPDRLSALGSNVGEVHNCLAIEAWLRRLIDSPTR